MAEHNYYRSEIIAPCYTGTSPGNFCNYRRPQIQFLTEDEARGRQAVRLTFEEECRMDAVEADIHVQEEANRIAREKDPRCFVHAIVVPPDLHEVVLKMTRREAHDRYEKEIQYRAKSERTSL